MAFRESLAVGRQAEKVALDYFNMNNRAVQDVRDEIEYRDIDVDFIVDGYGMVEVKFNLHHAMKGVPGKFFWIELRVGALEGWWYKTKADWFFFCNEKQILLIKNDEAFREFVEDAIENASHSNQSPFRYDCASDRRFNDEVDAENMRVYVDLLKDNGLTYMLIRAPRGV